MKDRLKKEKIGVLAGGLSQERGISLKSSRAILEALERKGYNAVLVDLKTEPVNELLSSKIDTAFIGLHGKYGEDGAIQGLLEMMKIPYTGSGILASALGMDKISSRRIFESQHISVPLYCILDKEKVNNFSADILNFDFPVVVKPRSEGSSIGVIIVENGKGIKSALLKALDYDHTIIIEQFIAGKEIHVGILEDNPLGAIEIIPKTKFYDYEAKYVKGMSEHIYPARLSESLHSRILSLALQAHKALECAVYSRVDFIISSESEPFLLEVNTLPGMTETSLLPEIAKGEGIAFDDLIEKILLKASLKIT